MKILLTIILSLFLLVGCKSELYSNLEESEANQMLALLLFNKINAEKTVAKEGVTLWVQQDQFVDAVEILRQNGFPARKIINLQDIFPSGQLVSSPEQEAAKLSYLKSQQLEKMLSSLDGVIRVEVSIAESNKNIDSGTLDNTSVSVFIKYSPEVNLQNRESEIRMLILNAVPGLSPTKISLAMQRTEYRYQPIYPEDLNKVTNISLFNIIELNDISIYVAGAIIFFVLVCTSTFVILRRRRALLT